MFRLLFYISLKLNYEGFILKEKEMKPFLMKRVVIALEVS